MSAVTASYALPATNPMRPALLAILLFEVIAFGLSVPVMILVSGRAPWLAAVAAGGTALLALIAAGTLRRPYGYLIAWAAQAAGVALGVLTNAMFVVGGVFLALWLLTFVLARRIEATRAT